MCHVCVVLEKQASWAAFFTTRAPPRRRARPGQGPGMPSPPHATPCHRGCGSAVAPLCGAPSRTTVSLPGEMAASVTQEPRCSCSDMNGAHANTCSSPAACMVQGQRSTHAQGQGHCPQAAPPNPTDRQQQRGERGGGGGGGSGSATIGFRSRAKAAREPKLPTRRTSLSAAPRSESTGAQRSSMQRLMIMGSCVCAALALSGDMMTEMPAHGTAEHGRAQARHGDRRSVALKAAAAAQALATRVPRRGSLPGSITQ